jgi:hypothetical protein
MRRSHGLFRPSGAFFRLQFSADYTITMFGFDFRQGQVLQDYLAVAEKEAESPTTADSIKCLRETLASFPK